MSEDVIILLARFEGETWEIKAVDRDGELGPMFEELINRIPDRLLERVEQSVWRAVAGERAQIIVERNMEITSLKRRIHELETYSLIEAAR